MEDGDYDDVNLSISDPLSPRLNQIDYFLSHQQTWSRNHLSTSVFALVYDTRDETSKIMALWRNSLQTTDFPYPY